MLGSMQAHQRAARAVAYEELDVGADPVGFQNLPPELFKTEFVVSEGPVRMLVTGEDPATVGVPGYDTDRFVLNAHEAVRFRAVRAGVTNGLLRVHHYVLA